MHLNRFFVQFYLIINILNGKISEKITSISQFKNKKHRILLVNCELEYNKNSTKIIILKRINVDIPYILNQKIIRNDYHGGEMKILFNDPDINQQWYFIKSDNTTYLSHDLKKVWVHNIYGLDVNIGILDDGIEPNHEELRQNFLSTMSYNFHVNSRNIFSSVNSRATEAAGLISAISNNWRCGVGAAPYSKVASLQIYYNQSRFFNDVILGRALSHLNHLIHIYLINWHIDDLLDIRRYPLRHTVRALNFGLKNGRRGLGNIYVAGSGNQKILGNNCAFNGFLQRKEILVIGAISHRGISPMYSEGCNAVLAVALSNEEDDIEDKIYTTSSNNMCKKSANGSFAAAAVGAGILALLISYNPELTIRQIIKLIVITSIQYDPYSVTNAAGFTYSNYFGFGLLNIYEMIARSYDLYITYHITENICFSDIWSKNILIKKESEYIVYIFSSGCLNLMSCVSEIEQIDVIFSMTMRKRNVASIFLISPSGTEFKIIDPRTFDNSRNGFHKWRLKILGFMGEKAAGIWKIRIICSTNSCRLIRFQLIFSGTCSNSQYNIRIYEKVRNFIFQYSELAFNLYERLLFNHTQNSLINTGNDPLSFTSQDFVMFAQLEAVLGQIFYL